jgi:hypothetical protein
MHALQPPADGAVHGLAKPRIRQINGHFADVIEAGTRFSEQLFDVPHRLVGLGGRIADPHVERGIEVLPNLAPNEHRPPPRDHGLTQIVVEILFGICVPRVELA